MKWLVHGSGKCLSVLFLKETGTGWLGDPNSEVINVVFQVLSQKMETKDEQVQEKIYNGPGIDNKTTISGYRAGK